MTGISFYCFLWRLISVRRVRASNGRQNRFFYRSHRNGQSRKNIVFMRLCGVSGIHFLRHGEQIILLFFIILLIQFFLPFAHRLNDYNGELPKQPSNSKNYCTNQNRNREKSYRISRKSADADTNFCNFVSH